MITGLYLAGACFVLFVLAVMWTYFEWLERMEERRQRRLVQRHLKRMGMWP